MQRQIQIFLHIRYAHMPEISSTFQLLPPQALMGGNYPNPCQQIKCETNEFWHFDKEFHSFENNFLRFFKRFWLIHLINYYLRTIYLVLSC